MKKLREVEDLREIRKNPDISYKIVKNIDASETKNWNNGKGFRPIETFYGELDGGGHTIENIFIESRTSSCLGIFNRNYGAIKNLSVTKSYISNKGTTGMIVGNNLVGDIKNVTVRNCYINGGRGSSGGICGVSSYGKIENCKVIKSKIFNSDKVGGVIGVSRGTTKISSCSSVSVEIDCLESSEKQKGLLIGWDYKNGSPIGYVIENVRDIKGTITSENQKVSQIIL